MTRLCLSRTLFWNHLNLADRADNRAGHSLRPFARLKPGVTREQAQAEMDAICSGLAKAYPDADAGFTVHVDLLSEKAAGKVQNAGGGAKDAVRDSLKK